MTAARRQARASVAVALGAVALCGCSAQTRTHGGISEDEVRIDAMNVALRERNSRDSDLYRVPLIVGILDRKTAPSGDEYWEATLVDPDGIRRMCIRVRSGGRSIAIRRCDPDGAPPPHAPDADQTGDAVRS